MGRTHRAFDEWKFFGRVKGSKTQQYVIAQSHQGIGILQGALRRGARAPRAPTRQQGIRLNFDTRHSSFGVLSVDRQFYLPCPQVNRLRLEMVQTACQLNVVYAVIASTVTAYKEPGSVQ